MKLYLFTLLFILFASTAEICSGLSWPFAKAVRGYQGVNSYYGVGGGYYSDAQNGDGHYGRDRRGNNRRSGRTFGDIARVVNPQPYAFVGARPFPGQPFNPIG
ncbi:uncharacterized protein LOC101458053 [Ceratitis capitata]|uniref:uncharacterized protein LOC101458053 n=1 Tax=Ceratitis capitata TaxID=7213 RepID=UPI000329BB72|nr:uncharacterized protein LOC101458053 [Ceratitis capitata]